MQMPDETTQTTGSIQRLPRHLTRRDIVSERRQSILQQKQTDALPRLDPDVGKISSRQLNHLREENHRLRQENEELQREYQQLFADYQAIQTEHDQQIATIHNGHLQEIEQFQSHLQETVDERNKLQNALARLQNAQETSTATFLRTVEAEAQKLLLEAAEALESDPEKIPEPLQDTVKIIINRTRQAEEQHLAETLHLKREIQRIAAEFERERTQLTTERQNLYILLSNARAQEEARHRELEASLRTRWAVGVRLLSVGLMLVLIVLQLITFSLFHVQLGAAGMISLLAPIFVSLVLALLVAYPLTMLKHLYLSAPHKVPVKKDA